MPFPPSLSSVFGAYGGRERTDSLKLYSDLHMHAMTHTGKLGHTQRKFKTHHTHIHVSTSTHTLLNLNI